MHIWEKKWCHIYLRELAHCTYHDDPSIFIHISFYYSLWLSKLRNSVQGEFWKKNYKWNFQPCHFCVNTRVSIQKWYTAYPCLFDHSTAAHYRISPVTHQWMNGRRDWNISKTELFKSASNLQKPYDSKGVNYIEKFNLREVMIKVHYRLTFNNICNNYLFSNG